MTKGYSIFQALPVCLQKHNLELSKLLGMFSYGAPYVIGSKYGMILLYRHINEFGLQNEYLPYHCIIHQHHITGNSLEFKGPWPISEFPDEAGSQYGEIATILKFIGLAEVIICIVYFHF
jgi:hypothetical protein